MSSIRYFILIAVVSVLVTSCRDTSSEFVPYKLPVICFNVSDSTSGEPNYEFEFTNCTQYADSFRWDFGDGTFSTEKSPKHEYSNYGEYTVELTAYKNDHVVTGTMPVKYGKYLLNNASWYQYYSDNHWQWGNGCSFFEHEIYITSPQQDSVCLSDFTYSSKTCNEFVPGQVFESNDFSVLVSSWTRCYSGSYSYHENVYRTSEEFDLSRELVYDRVYFSDPVGGGSLYLTLEFVMSYSN